MIRIRQILSECQSDVNDLANERIQPGEWLDIVHAVLNDISQISHIWIGRISIVPNTGLKEYDANTQYFYGDLVRDTNSGVVYRAWETNNIPVGSLPSPLYWVATSYPPTIVEIPWDNNVYKINRVTRTYSNAPVECQEWTYQSVKRNIDGVDPISVNQFPFGKFDYMTQFQDTTGRLRNMSLIFSETFELDDVVIIDFISNKPITLTAWTGNGVSGTLNYTLVTDDGSGEIEIPDFLYKPLKWGTLWQAMEKLFMKGDDACIERANRAKILYDKYLLDASGYAKQFRNTIQNYRAQPVNWLAE